jgi:exo-beta-1,3-glucanase (GH17 family)
MKICVTCLLMLVGLLFAPGKAQAARSMPPKLRGVAYGAFRDGQSPMGNHPSKREIREDLKLLRGITRRIRTYSVNETQELIPRLARKAKLECFVGAHVGADPDANSKEIQALIRIGRKARPAALVVGNEVFYHGGVSVSHLIDLVRRVKSDRKIDRRGIPIGYAAAHDTLLDPPDGFDALLAELDFLMVNLHPYWAGVPVEDAAEWTCAAWLEIAQVRFPGLEVIIGETGWPTAGRRAEANPENQRRFLEDFARLALERNIPYFWFEAFDEKWKQEASGVVEEAHWGLFDPDRTPKPRIADFFASPPVLIDILRPARRGSATDRMRKIAGRVYGIDPSERGDYRVLIYSGASEWSVQPLVRIRGSLRWSGKTRPGDVYAALLVRESHIPADALPFRDWSGDVVPPPVRLSGLLPPVDGDVLASVVANGR